MKTLALMVMSATLAPGAQVALAGTMLCGGSVIRDGEPEPVTE